MFLKRKRNQSSKVPRSLLPRKKLSRVSKRSSRVGSDEEILVRRTQWWWTNAYVALWFVFLGSCVYIFFFSPFLLVHQVRIEGTKTVDVDQVRKEVDLELQGSKTKAFLSNNLLAVSSEKVEQRLLGDFPQIRSVEVKRVFPDTLVVRIREREAKVVWCSGGPCFLVDEDGYAYMGIDEGSIENLPEYVVKIVDGSGQVADLSEPIIGREFLDFSASTRESVKQILDMDTEREGTTPSRLSLEIRLKMKAGWVLMLDADQPLEESLHAVQLFLKKGIHKDDQSRLRYVDARNSRIYYTLEGEEAQPETDSQEAVIPAQASEKQSRPSKEDREKKK